MPLILNRAIWLAESFVDYIISDNCKARSLELRLFFVGGYALRIADRTGSLLSNSIAYANV